MNEKRIYTIAGTKWYQGPLTYEELGSIGKLVPNFNEMFKKEDIRFGEVAQNIYDAGLIPGFFYLVLKPHYPSPWAFLAHWFFRIARRTRRKNLARTMTLEEIFAVIADFFFINTSWIESLMTSDDTSGSRMKGLLMMQTMLGFPLPLPTSLSFSPAGTPQESKPQNDSSGSPPPSS